MLELSEKMGKIEKEEMGFLIEWIYWIDYIVGRGRKQLFSEG
jgi:hypothetical protein